MRLYAPRWTISLAFAALAAALFCWPAWPGYMSYDSLFAYEQARFGVQTALWPPLHTYLFQLSDAAGLGAGGLFAAQAFLLFLAAALAINLLTASARLAIGLAVAFAAAFAVFPTLAGTLFAQWRDVPTASFTIAALAAWLLAARRASAGWLVVSAAFIGLATALRYNAFALMILVVPMMLWRPYLGRPAGRRARLAVFAALGLFLGLAWASTHWRLPDGMALPDAHNLGGTQEWDVIGVSACADRNYLPPALTGGLPITPYQIRQAYDPRHMHLTLAAHPGVPKILESDAAGEVPKLWRRLLQRETCCYLAHRTAVFVEQMGLAKGEVFYPVHEGIDANGFGLKLAHPHASAWAARAVKRAAPAIWRRPAWLYLLAAVLGLVAAWRRSERLWLTLALLGGCFAYPAVLFLAAPAADARYIFPSNVLCVLVVVLGVGALLERRGKME